MNEFVSSRRIGLAACMALGITLAGCHRDRPADHLARGKEALTKQDHATAVIEFKNVLQLDPKVLEARFLLGSELLRQGKPRDAEIELQKVYDSDYDPDRVLPLLVRSQVLQGQVDKATGLIANAKLKSPASNASLQTLLGTILLNRGKQDEALAAFEAARKFDPDEPDALLGEARIKAIRGDLAGATAEVDEVLVKHPKHTAGLVLKGDLARARKDNQAAIDAYLAAIEQSPNDTIAKMNLASTYVATNQLEAAQKLVDALKKESARNPGVAYLDALIAFNKKDYARADAAIDISLAGSPNSAVSQLLAGAISSALNHPEQAEGHLRESLKLNPNNTYARKLLANSFLRSRQPQKAEEILSPALAGAPEDAAVNNLEGQIALMKGDFASASKYFDKAGKIDPKDVNSRTQGAAVDFARGDEAGGFAALEAASKVSVDNPNPDIALVLARLQRRQYDEAMTAWKSLEKREPDRALTYNLRAAISLGQGDAPGAKKALERAVELQPTYFPAVANLATIDEQNHDLDGARKRFKALLAKDPGNLSALLALSKFEDRNGAGTDVVLPLLKEARRSNPGSEQAVVALAAYYVKINDSKQALAVVQDGLSSSSNSPVYLNLSGQLLMKNGSNDQAIAAFRKLVSVNPENVESQVRLGQVLLASNQAPAAVQVFDNALKSHPTAYQAHSMMVESLLRAGKVEEASRLLGEARATAPKSPALPELDGDVKMASKQFPEALASYRKAISQTPSSSLVIKTYNANVLSGHAAEANVFFADWLKSHPKDPTLQMFDAELALRTKDYPRAAKVYRATLEQRPNDAVVLNNLAWVLWQQKDPQALSFAQKASAIAPNSPEIGDTLGWMLVEQGQLKQGLAILEKAAAAAPAKRELSLHLAKAQLKDGRKEEARSTLQEIVDEAPDSAEGKESKGLMATL